MPTYAHSAVYGEIWPMIAEKAWAKLTGSYGGMNAGMMDWVLAHVTNDPIVKTKLNSDYTVGNTAGKELWAQIKAYSDKEYLMFTGTSSSSWVGGHAYTLLEAKEMSINGVTEKLVKMRNPWGSSKW